MSTRVFDSCSDLDTFPLGACTNAGLPFPFDTSAYRAENPCSTGKHPDTTDGFADEWQLWADPVLLVGKGPYQLACGPSS